MIFIIVAPPGPEAYPAEERISKAFPNDFYKFSDGVFFVAAEGTTSVDVARKIGVEPGKPSPQGPLMVINAAGYFGLGGTDMWEWLRAKGSPAPPKIADGVTS